MNSSSIHRDTIPWTNLNSPVFSADMKSMVMIYPLLQGSLGYFPHIVQRVVSDDQQQVSVPLTQGRFEVTEIVDWDEHRNIV